MREFKFGFQFQTPSTKDNNLSKNDLVKKNAIFTPKNCQISRIFKKLIN